MIKIELHIPGHYSFDMDYIFWCHNRSQPYGPGAAKKNDIVSKEAKVDGRWYKSYYRILSDKPEFRRGGFTYEAERLTKEEAKALCTPKQT